MTIVALNPTKRIFLADIQRGYAAGTYNAPLDRKIFPTLINNFVAYARLFIPWETVSCMGDSLTLLSRVIHSKTSLYVSTKALVDGVICILVSYN